MGTESIRLLFRDDLETMVLLTNGVNVHCIDHIRQRKNPLCLVLQLVLVQNQVARAKDRPSVLPLANATSGAKEP